MTKLIEDNVLQGIVSYLQKRPYDEVYQIFPILMNLPDAHKPEESDSENKKTPAEAEVVS